MGARGGARSHKVLPPPPPGLAGLRDRARHKRRVVAVPPTLPPPPSALRRRTRPRGLGAGSPRRPGRARSLGASLDAAGASWCALRAAPQQELSAPQIKRLRRGGEMERKGKTYLGAEGSAGLPLRTRQVSGTEGPGGRRWRSSELGST